jgi:pimeloyl-ACP methyl ester carboxylesterase
MADPSVLTAGGMRVAYRGSGPAEAPALVLLHALGETGADWAAVSAHLSSGAFRAAGPGGRGGFRCYAVDLRGHGASEWPGRYSVELMRDDLWAFLDALRLDRVGLIGHSLGAMVATLAAMDRPARVERLVLEDPPPLRRAVPPREVPPRPPEPLDFDWAVVAPLTRQRNEPDPAWWDGLGRITAPTLVVAGGPDSHLPQDQIAQMAARIPRSRLVTIPAGHLVHETRPAEFLAVVDEFLTTTAGGEPAGAGAAQ